MCGMMPPAEVGMHVGDVDTPALVLDLDAFERNLHRMSGWAERAKVRVRPHAKSHKCPEIARRQVALGAVGICCQKVSEAEAMIQSGAMNVLITNQVVGARKLERLVDLAARAWVATCVDNAVNAADLNAAAARAGVTLNVLVEIDNGANRCGVLPGAAALDLAQKIAGSSNLNFSGLQAYQGRAQHIRDANERRNAVERAAFLTSETAALLAKHGLACEIVGGAGTGTYRFEALSGPYNEVQPGSYVFMDADYRRNLDEDGRSTREFEQSLHVLATVMSRPTAGRVVVDAGLKAFSTDSGMPLVAELGNLAVERASDEHGVFVLPPGVSMALGQKIRLIPGHCDPTVNLHDWIVGVRNHSVECVWPVAARGHCR
jgi:D-serine deaminase-like pyridoxal phosphate-dependent protein